ncbi:MAG: hypothetical protein ABIQ03_04350 [Burkholderiales bacterium]
MQVIESVFPWNGGDCRLAVLSPYLIPENLRDRKVVNLGDGFIFRAIERLLGRFAPQRIFSPRVALSVKAQKVLEDSSAVILAGANQLNDRYTVWPGLSAERIRASRLRMVPFGIGLHGQPGYTDQLSDATKDVLIAMHERIEFSAWRCPHTVGYLRRELPQLGPQLLMTGCPVLYDRPLLEGKPFNTGIRRIAVTITDRHDFWTRESAVIDFVARRFPRSVRYLVLHQNYSPPKLFEQLRYRWLPHAPSQLNDYQRLRQFAVRRGFKVVSPRNADACITFYDGIDMHVGSRLHAHLLFLSRARRSWLVPVDARATGMAEFLGFPLCNPGELEAALDFDFEIVRAQASEGFGVMRSFVKTLPQ